MIDGGRTIRGARERFTIARDPPRPVKLVLRTGGRASYPYQETLRSEVELRVLAADGRELGRATLPVPDGTFVEVAFDLPAGAPATLTTEASAPYRAFHWFALQPEPSP